MTDTDAWHMYSPLQTVENTKGGAGGGAGAGSGAGSGARAGAGGGGNSYIQNPVLCRRARAIAAVDPSVPVSLVCGTALARDKGANCDLLLSPSGKRCRQCIIALSQESCKRSGQRRRGEGPTFALHGVAEDPAEERPLAYPARLRQGRPLASPTTPGCPRTSSVAAPCALLQHKTVLLGHGSKALPPCQIVYLLKPRSSFSRFGTLPSSPPCTSPENK